MDTKIPPATPRVGRPGAVAVESAPRPTPTPVRVRFADVLAAGAGGLVRGAEVAMRSLPGPPLMAVSVRGPAGAAAAGVRAPKGPGAVGVGVGVGVGGVGVNAGTAGTPGDGGIESALQQSAEMNLYYLQIQEEVNAQNRTYTALSNVLKTEHDTVKTAIGNIR